MHRPHIFCDNDEFYNVRSCGCLLQDKKMYVNDIVKKIPLSRIEEYFY